MKKSWPITILFCLLIIGGGAAVILWPRTVPLQECSEIYQKYAKQPMIKASFIQDFIINDTVSVNVTLLQSIDSTGWATLRKDFNIPKLDSEMQQLINNGDEMVFTIQVDKHDYSHIIKGYSPDVELLAISYLMKSVCIFHVNDEDEIHAVLFYNLDNSTKK